MYQLPRGCTIAVWPSAVDQLPSICGWPSGCQYRDKWLQHHVCCCQMYQKVGHHCFSRCCAWQLEAKLACESLSIRGKRSGRAHVKQGSLGDAAR